MQALYATPAWACCFLCIQFVCIIFLKVWGGVENIFWYMMHYAWCRIHSSECSSPPPPSLWAYRLCLKNRLFCTCAHAWCHIHFFHHGKFYFRFRQLIAFPVSGQLCCDSQGKESSTFFSGNMKCPLHCYISPFWGSSSFFRLSAFFRLSSFFWLSLFFR